MTTEREQIELAAKACGLVTQYLDERSQWLLVEGVRTPLQGKHRWYWNPLEDDGDCARMEAQLGICIDWCNEMVCSCTVVDEDGNYISKDVYFKDHAGDKNAARRAASVAVAAEIGRMK